MWCKAIFFLVVSSISVRLPISKFKRWIEGGSSITNELQGVHEEKAWRWRESVIHRMFLQKGKAARNNGVPDNRNGKGTCSIIRNVSPWLLSFLLPASIEIPGPGQWGVCVDTALSESHNFKRGTIIHCVPGSPVVFLQFPSICRNHCRPTSIICPTIATLSHLLFTSLSL